MKTELKEQQIIKATEIMEQLKIYKPYITGLKGRKGPCFFENFAGFWAYQEPVIDEKIKEIESKYECLVYAVTHEYTQFGECYDLLIIPKTKSEWKGIVGKYENNYYAFAYVWNKDDDFCSEFGDVIIKSAFGGIRRVG